MEDAQVPREATDTLWVEVPGFGSYAFQTAHVPPLGTRLWITPEYTDLPVDLLVEVIGYSGELAPSMTAGLGRIHLRVRTRQVER